MDNVSGKPLMTFFFSGTHFEGENLPSPYDIVLGMVAKFEIRVGEDVIYSEPELPVAELAIKLKLWLENGFQENSAFEYVSMESDVPGMVWIRPKEKGWRIGSIYQTRSDDTQRTSEEVVSIVTDFINEVSVRLPERSRKDRLGL